MHSARSFFFLRDTAKSKLMLATAIFAALVQYLFF